VRTSRDCSKAASCCCPPDRDGPTIPGGWRCSSQLAEVGAAGIVLELGAHYRYVPAVLADAARSADIALIVLHREVKFVTITEAVHRRIIADQTAALEARDAVRTLFTGLALRGAPTEFIVEQVGLTLAAPVVLESVGHEVVVAHVGGATETRTLRDWARRSAPPPRHPTGRGARSCRWRPAASAGDGSWRCPAPPTSPDATPCSSRRPPRSPWAGSPIPAARSGRGWGVGAWSTR
jgi:hypothetical protein